MLSPQFMIFAATLFLVTPEQAPQNSATSIETVTQKAIERKLHEDRFWHLLIRYQKTLWGYESEADAPGFFIADSGKTDPQAELVANIQALLSPTLPPGSKVHPQCRFPARFKWLWQQLNLEQHNVPVAHCPEVISFMQTMKPSRVVLVFASAFLNAPPSMYGHSFLRFDNVNHPNTLMLSNIINFAANPTTNNPLSYTIQGIFGGFPGRFAGMPYYVKIREYSDMDSRDLWEYEIPLNADQIDWMLRYAWDLDQTHFDYYFFTENCSYHILDLIHIAYPDFTRETPLPWFSIPFDAIRILRDQIPGMKAPVYRPSHTTKMKARRTLLTSEESNLAETIARGRSPNDFVALKELSPERQALTLDAAHDRFKYLTGFDDKVDNQEAKAIDARDLEILNYRRDISVQASEPSIVRPPAPHEGHATARTTLAVGAQEAGSIFGEIRHRRALHDALDLQRGFVPNTNLEMMSFQLRFHPQALHEENNHTNSVLLEKLDFIKVMSLMPISPWVKPISWRVNLRFERVADLGCLSWSCTAFTLQAGPGFALETSLVGKELFYGFTEVHLSAGPAYEKKGRISASASLGLLVQPAAFWRLHVEAGYFADYPTPQDLKFHRLQLKAGTNVALSQNFALRAEMQQERTFREATFSFLYYH